MAPGSLQGHRRISDTYILYFIVDNGFTTLTEAYIQMCVAYLKVNSNQITDETTRASHVIVLIANFCLRSWHIHKVSSSSNKFKFKQFFMRNHNHELQQID